MLRIYYAYVAICNKSISTTSVEIKFTLLTDNHYLIHNNMIVLMDT